MSIVLFGTLLPAIVLVPLGLYLLTVILSLINLSSLFTWIILLLSSAVIVYHNHQSWGLTQVFYLNSGLTILVFVVGRHFSVKIIEAKQTLQHKLASNQQLMENFLVYDPETGLMRRRFAEETLAVEVARSHRLDTPLSLMMMRVPKEKNFPDGKVYDPSCFFAELFGGNLREKIDIAFIDEDYGTILPEMNLHTAQFTAWQMVQDMQNVLGIDIRIGVANITEDITAADVLMTAAKSALEMAVEIDQPIVTHLFMKAPPVNSLNFNQLLEGVSEEALIAYLQNPKLGDQEWIVWLEGIQDIEKLHWINDRFDLSHSVQVLGVWGQFLIVKLRIGETDATEFAAAFSGWQLLDTDIDQRFAWVVSESS